MFPVRCAKGNGITGKPWRSNTRIKTSNDVLEMTVDEGLEFFASLPKIARKLQTLQDVGLGYVKIGQSSTTLPEERPRE